MNYYAYYLEIARAKLAGLKQSSDTGAKDLFVDVKIGGNAKLSGYPSAIVYKKPSTAQIQTTKQNQREFQIGVVVYHQFSAGIDNDTAESQMTSAVDIILQALDKDIDLGGTCDFVKAVPANFSYSITQAPFISADFTISIVQMVNRQ